MNKLFLKLTLAAAVLLINTAQAQKLDELQHIYPDKLAVFSNV